MISYGEYHYGDLEIGENMKVNREIIELATGDKEKADFIIRQWLAQKAKDVVNA